VPQHHRTLACDCGLRQSGRRESRAVKNAEAAEQH